MKGVSSKNMGKLIKYLKKYALSVIAILFLLLVQAYCALALPDSMSSIVNVGIQQGGISNAAPMEIREKQMNRLFYFMSDDEKTFVEDNYTLQDKEENGEKLYVLNENADSKTIDELSSAFEMPMTIVSFLQSENEQTKALKAQLAAGKTDKSISILDILDAMPQKQKSAVLADINTQLEKFDDIDQSMSKQMAISFVKEEYKAIGIDTAKIQNEYILQSGLIMVVYALAIAVSSVLVSLLASRVGSGLACELRRDVFRKVVGFSNKEYNSFSTASLITRCTNDIQQIQMLVIMLLRMVIYAPILGIGALVNVMKTGKDMAWVIAVAIGLILVLIMLLMIFAMPKFNILQKLVDRLNLVSREMLTGLPVIRAFSREKYEEKRFDAANTDLMRANLFVNRIMSAMMPVMMLIMNGICVLIVWVGADIISVGQMQVGNLMAFIQYTMQIIMSFLMLSMMSIMLPRAMVSAKRVAEVLNTENTVKDIENPEQMDSGKSGIVEFKNVCFRYPGAEEDVLHNINFVAKPGQTTAFIGSTGSGKSTLISLIPRFYDVTDGEIKIGGKDIRKISKKSLRDLIGYVPQKGFLFTGDINSNISYGAENITQQQIEKAAEISQSAEFINEKPDKYSYAISQGGTNVSGGQRQRLSIARAIAKNPQIYIFDDSFSALDFKTDAALRKALKTETKDSTVLIVAQRISTILNADQIIVLDNGEIVGKGTHKELLKNCEVYRQIAQSQLSKEELENE